MARAGRKGRSVEWLKHVAPQSSNSARVDQVFMGKNEKGLLAHDNQVRFGQSRQTKMAFAKPVRLLAAACMVLFLFITVQIMRNPGPVTPPGFKEKDNYASFARDPNLDGTINKLQIHRRLS
jgi:hypothetical protein